MSAQMKICIILFSLLSLSPSCVAFKSTYWQVKTTHSQRYAVTPNKGVLSPNCSVTLRVTFCERERKKLWKLLEYVGHSAINMGADNALLILSCNRDRMTEKKTDMTKIKIHHYITPEDGGLDTRPVLSPFQHFPATAAVHSCMDEIEKDDNRSCCEKAVVAVCTWIVLITGSLTMGLGFFPLHLGLNSLLKIVLDRGEWVNQLQNLNQNGVEIEGRVVRREKRVDGVLGEVNYLVQLQYEGTEEDGDVRTCLVSYSSLAVAHGGKELYEMTNESSLVTLKMLPGCPSSAIPSFLLEKKLIVSSYWARRQHYLRAILGILTYLGLGSFWLILSPVYIGLPCLVGGIVLLVPFSVALDKKERALKRKLVLIEPASIPTEYHDALTWVLGKIARRLKVIMAIVGALTVFMMAAPGFIILVIGGFFPLIILSWSSRLRKSLKSFEEQAISVRGKVFSHRASWSDKTTSYYATIRYALRIYGDDIYIFEHEFKSDHLYSSVGKAVQVMVHPNHPRSGLPRQTLMNIIWLDTCSSRLGAPLSISIATCLYFLLHWVIYDYQGGEDSLGTVIVMWIITFVAPILVIPQILVWGEKEHNQSEQLFFSGANVVGFRKQCRRQRDKPNDHLEKAIQVDVEEEHNATLIAKAVPALLEDEFNHTVATELTDGESTIASTDSNYLECFDNDGDSHEYDGLVLPDIV
mmetsp:Transcript_21752/g.39962  ORF Transcript_21752/g.39962 Transcript_21752/m.39962 type:complete len:695 (+) Transcript_21752:100-2184(+)